MRTHGLIALVATVVASYSPPGLAQAAPNDNSPSSASCTVGWVDPVVLGNGSLPAVSVNGPSRMVIEINPQPGAGLVYRLGKISQVASYAEFGPAVSFGEGSYPGVSINTDGLLMEVHQDWNAAEVTNNVFYRIGKIDLSGGVDQSVVWSSPIYSYDGGMRPQVAINDSGTVVEVHETNNLFNHKLYYHTGHIVKNGENYYMVWDSGGSGIEYDAGRNPHITLDNEGNVVEVHESIDTKNLHYRRGRVNNELTRVDWAPAASNGRFQTGNTEDPAVSLSNDGFVLEAHNTYSPKNVIVQYGQVNENTDNVVDWVHNQWEWQNADYVSLSANGSKAIAVFHEYGGGNLLYSVGIVICPP